MKGVIKKNKKRKIKKVLDIFQKLKTTDNRSEFKKGVKKLRTLLLKCSKKNKEQPLYYFLSGLKQNVCIPDRYMFAVNTKKQFRIDKWRTGLSFLKNCKKRELIIPLHIDNKITHRYHLNLLILRKKRNNKQNNKQNNIWNKKNIWNITRIEPTNIRKNKLTNIRIKDGLEIFFNKRKININYLGFDKKSKFIKHGGLCNYAAPVEYLLGRKITINKLKKYIIRYFDNQIKNCINNNENYLKD